MPRVTRRSVLQSGAVLGGAMAVPGWAALPRSSLDRRLWYRQPAKEWTEALPIGNGWDVRSASVYVNTRKTSIFGGSNEIQRNIIAKAVLGL